MTVHNVPIRINVSKLTKIWLSEKEEYIYIYIYMEPGIHNLEWTGENDFEFLYLTCAYSFCNEYRSFRGKKF